MRMAKSVLTIFAGALFGLILSVLLLSLHDASMTATATGRVQLLVGTAFGALFGWSALAFRKAKTRLNLAEHDFRVRLAMLQQRELRMMQFADSGADWLWETNKELEFSWVSEGLEERLGIPAQHFLGANRRSRASMDNYGVDWLRHQETLQARKSFKDFRYPLKFKGETKWINTSGLPAYDADGEFQGYRGTARDVTELVLEQRKNQELSELLASVVDSLQDTFSLWDPDGKLLFGNPSFFAANVALGEEVRPGVTFSRFIELSATANIEIVGAVEGANYQLERLRNRALANPEPEVLKRPDGEIYQVVSQRLKDGSTISLGRNITSARLVAERFELATTGVSIWDHNFATGEFYISPGFAGRLGYLEDEFTQKLAGSLQHLMPQEDSQDFMQKLEAVTRGRSGEYASQHRFVAKSGVLKTFWVVGKVNFDTAGNPIRFSGVLSDVSYQAKLEEQVRHAQKMEAIGNLTGGIAHDFNNLLAVVLSSFELAAESGNVEEFHKFADIGVNAVQRGQELIDSLLSFAKISPLRPKIVDLNSLIDASKALLETTVRGQMQLKYELTSASCIVKLDETFAQTAILNLILNARDAKVDDPEIVIRTSLLSVHSDGDEMNPSGLGPGQYAVLSISDKGAGIPAEHLPSIFEPFFTTKASDEGTGLGLSMVHGFMEQSGGAVEVVSETDLGTTFRLIFPIAEMSEAVSLTEG